MSSDGFVNVLTSVLTEIRTMAGPAALFIPVLIIEIKLPGKLFLFKQRPLHMYRLLRAFIQLSLGYATIQYVGAKCTGYRSNIHLKCHSHTVFLDTLRPPKAK